MIPDDVRFYVLVIDFPDREGYDDSWWDYDTEQMVARQVVGVFDSEGAARQALSAGLDGFEAVQAYVTAVPFNRIGSGEFVARRKADSDDSPP